MPLAADTTIISSSSNEGAKINTPRRWLVMFAEPRSPAWWARVLRPGFRHCYAVAWYADQECWVEFNPTRVGTVIRLWKKEDFPARLTVMLAESTVVLRVIARADRGNAPAIAFCVGQMKALLGIRSWALTPFGLYRDLRKRGAEVVTVDEPQSAASATPQTERQAR